MSYHEDEEKKETLEAIGILSAGIIWFVLFLTTASIIGTFKVRYLPLFQRNVILRNEKAMLENEIKYRFATDTGIKIKMEEK